MSWSLPRLVAFDLDGVLVDTRGTHVSALSKVLERIGFPIEESVLWSLDGLSTRQRLRELVSMGLFPDEPWLIDLVDSQKALATDRTIEANGVIPLFETEQLRNLIRELRAVGTEICVVSNARRSTVELCLSKIGLGTCSLTKYISFIVAGDDGFGKKPDAGPYLHACRTAGVLPSECVAIDDSPRGRASARSAGCRLLPFDPGVTLSQVKRFCLYGRYPTTVLIPMAGSGERFSRVGFDLPKPMIDVAGEPMVKRAIDCLPPEANYVFMLPPCPVAAPKLEALVANIRPSSIALSVTQRTEGAACTVMLGEGLVEPDERIVVANCDQLVTVDWDSVLIETASDAGFVLVFEASGEKWSYALSDETGLWADSFVEKRQVGNLATCGVYSVRRASALFDAIRQMISSDDRVNGEFYLCPALNYLPKGRPLRLVRSKMVGLGTPEDLAAYLESLR